MPDHYRTQYTVTFSEYEFVNLLSALLAIYQGTSPLGVMNSGDWIGQIVWMMIGEIEANVDDGRKLVYQGNYDKLWETLGRPNQKPEVYRDLANKQKRIVLFEMKEDENA